MTIFAPNHGCYIDHNPSLSIYGTPPRNYHYVNSLIVVNFLKNKLPLSRSHIDIETNKTFMHWPLDTLTYNIGVQYYCFCVEPLKPKHPLQTMEKKSQKMKMNVDSDISTVNISNKDNTSKLVDGDEPSPLIGEVFKMLKQLMLTVNENNFSLMEIKVDQVLLKETLAEMRNSLKLLEVDVCTQDLDILPPKHNTSTKVHMAVGVESDKGKSVAIEWDDDDANNDIIFDIPDEENDDNTMKSYHYMPTMNVETTLDTIMPIISECWTKPSTSHPNKSNNEEHQIVKKLFGSPPTFGEGISNEPVESPSLPLLTIKKRSRTSNIPKPTRTPSSYLPKKFSSQLLFKCTAETFLEPKEIQACSYFFYKFGKKE